jgi:hypothetical protein
VAVTDVGERRDRRRERQHRKCWLDSKRSRDSAAKMPGGQAKMSEDLGNHRRIFNSSDDFRSERSGRPSTTGPLHDP